MALQFTRDVQVAIKLGSDIWEVPVLDGFSFSQAINSSEITVSESGATSRRGRLLFNDSLAPVEWSLSTYARPTLDYITVPSGTLYRGSFMGYVCRSYFVYYGLGRICWFCSGDANTVTATH